MVTTGWIALAVAAVAAVADWVAVARDRTRLEYVAKPLTMAALIVAALTLDAPDATRQTWFVMAAVFSLAGDVFLMLPRDRFVAGLASFLVAHICYVVGLLQSDVTLTAALLGVAVVVGGMLTVGRRVVTAVRSSQPPLLAPVVVYMGVISAMVVAAFAAGPVVAIAGAVLFFASDSILAWRRFVAPLPWGGVAVMVTYHLAQACLLLSLAVT